MSRWILPLALALVPACAAEDDPKDDDLDIDIDDGGGDGTTDGGGSGDDAGDDGTTTPDDRPGLPACSASDGHATTIERMVSSTTGVVIASVSYGGGCSDHAFELCWPSGEFSEELPVSVQLELLHSGPPDACEGWITEDIELDVTSMADAYADAYGAGGGEMVLMIHGNAVSYTF